MSKEDAPRNRRVQLGFISGDREKLQIPSSKEEPSPKRAHLVTPTGARAVPARSTPLGRRVVGHSGAFMLATVLRTGRVCGPVGGGVNATAPSSKTDRCAVVPAFVLRFGVLRLGTSLVFRPR